MFWLGGGRRLWAMLHRPMGERGPAPIRRAAVFCPPFAEEEKCSRRLYVDLARALARRGVATVRISYAGTGDSEGEFQDFTVESALGDIRRALDWCRSELGEIPLATFGLRLGGTFALQAAWSDPRVDRLALWSPITNGSAYVRMSFRRKAIRQMINTGAAGPGPGAAATAGNAAAAQDDGIFDFDGYPVARSLWDQMDALETVPKGAWAHDALVVSVGATQRPSTEFTRLAGALEDRKAHVQVDAVVSQPFWNLLGLAECPEIIELTAGWLATPAPPEV